MTAVGGPPNSYAHTRKVLRAQALADRANAVVAGCTAPALDRNFSRHALEVIVDNETVGGGGAEVLQSFAHGLAGVVHGALGAKVGDLQRGVDSNVAGDVSHGRPLQVRRLDNVDQNIGANIVTRTREQFRIVTEPNYETHFEWGGCALVLFVWPHHGWR